ncbi:MAG TPA: LamG-like jellyroll fold domain-containing protein [Kofleriaceae bacterium]|jgi:hypothetical protein|nr:LamG-like jellyroll fold domain-containing protein [Kofleriaceae bacterium]
MRGWVAILAAAGCGFEHGQLEGMTGTGDSSVADDARTDGAKTIDGAIDAATVVPACLDSDPNLAWCLEFDEPGLATAATAKDGSGHDHDPTLSNVNATSRNVPAGTSSQAISLTINSSISIAKPADFNVNDFTMMAWIYRTSSNELGVIDTAFQYTLSIEPTNHTVLCAIASSQGTAVEYWNGSQTAINEWDLIACTYDGAQTCTYSFRNGSTTSQKACTGRNSTTATNGSTSSAGMWTDSTRHFVGAIDQVRLYSRALSTKEICVAGGLAGC